MTLKIFHAQISFAATFFFLLEHLGVWVGRCQGEREVGPRWPEDPGTLIKTVSFFEGGWMELAKKTYVPYYIYRYLSHGRLI